MCRVSALLVLPDIILVPALQPEIKPELNKPGHTNTDML